MHSNGREEKLLAGQKDAASALSLGSVSDSPKIFLR